MTSLFKMQGITRRILSTTYSQLKHLKTLQRQSLSTSTKLFGLYERDGLDDPPEIPEYEELFLRIRGYDFPQLEDFTKYCYRQAKRLNMDPECVAAPAHVYTVSTLKPRSVKVEHQYKLYKYERRVMMEDVPSTFLPTYMDLIRQNTPEGVEVCLKVPEPEEKEYLYIPDLLLEDLQAKMEESTKKKKN